MNEAKPLRPLVHIQSTTHDIPSDQRGALCRLTRHLFDEALMGSSMRQGLFNQRGEAGAFEVHDAIKPRVAGN